MNSDIFEYINDLPNLVSLLLVPKNDSPIHYSDFKQNMEFLVLCLGISDSYKGCGHEIHFEKARRSNLSSEEAFNSNRFQTYYANFENFPAALSFMNEVNNNQNSVYTAEIPTMPVGLSRFTHIEEIEL